MSKNRPSSHTKAQKAGRERDSNTCQICGSKSHVEGHHIIDYQYSGVPSTDNIISLCHEHHKAVHNGLISLLKF